MIKWVLSLFKKKKKVPITKDKRFISPENIPDELASFERAAFICGYVEEANGHLIVSINYESGNRLV